MPSHTNDTLLSGGRMLQSGKTRTENPPADGTFQRHDLPIPKMAVAKEDGTDMHGQSPHSGSCSVTAQHLRADHITSTCNRRCLVLGLGTPYTHHERYVPKQAEAPQPAECRVQSADGSTANACWGHALVIDGMMTNNQSTAGSSSVERIAGPPPVISNGRDDRSGTPCWIHGLYHARCG